MKSASTCPATTAAAPAITPSLTPWKRWRGREREANHERTRPSAVDLGARRPDRRGKDARDGAHHHQVDHRASDGRPGEDGHVTGNAGEASGQIFPDGRRSTA